MDTNEGVGIKFMSRQYINNEVIDIEAITLPRTNFRIDVSVHTYAVEYLVDALRMYPDIRITGNDLLELLKVAKRYLENKYDS